VQDPEAYLERLDRASRLTCPVHRDRDAILDPRYRAYVNHEIYFFSSDAAVQEFRRRPLRYVDEVTDPVSLVRFIPDETSSRIDHEGRPYFFVDAATRRRFAANPEAHANPSGIMLN